MVDLYVAGWVWVRVEDVPHDHPTHGGSGSGSGSGSFQIDGSQGHSPLSLWRSLESYDAEIESSDIIACKCGGYCTKR